MEKEEILNILREINDMDNLETIDISIGDVHIKIEKKAKVEVIGSVPRALATPPVVFNQANEYKADENRPSNLATVGQIKFAKDLVDNLGKGDESKVVNFLAHALEIPTEDVLAPETWETTMTREIAGLYLDILGPEWDKERKGGRS